MGILTEILPQLSGAPYRGCHGPVCASPQVKDEAWRRISGQWRKMHDQTLVDKLEGAIDAESRARLATIAAAEQFAALNEHGPTEEEILLRSHLVGQWERAAQALAELIHMPDDAMSLAAQQS
jgi:hypothetical protein